MDRKNILCKKIFFQFVVSRCFKKDQSMDNISHYKWKTWRRKFMNKWTYNASLKFIWFLWKIFLTDFALSRFLLYRSTFSRKQIDIILKRISIKKICRDNLLQIPQQTIWTLKNAKSVKKILKILHKNHMNFKLALYAHFLYIFFVKFFTWNARYRLLIGLS